MLPMLLVTLWTVHEVRAGAPSNVCVDACQVLRHAFGQFAVPAGLAAAEVTVEDPVRGISHYGSAVPSWDGTELDGHCILSLPSLGRFADPTVTQFPAAAVLGKAPVIGLVGPGANGTSLQAGSRFSLPRGDGTLLYTIASRAATRVITGNPWIVQHWEDHHRAGINLASHAIDVLRQPQIIERALEMPFLRVTALLRAVGDSPADFDDPTLWHFLLPTAAGGREPARLDQVPLPIGTPQSLC
jgi:hypothetical protein